MTLAAVLLQGTDLLKDGAGAATKAINGTTDAVLAQDNFLVKVMWGVCVAALLLLALILFGGYLGMRLHGWFKEEKKARDDKQQALDDREQQQKDKDDKIHAALTSLSTDLTRQVGAVATRMEGLVELLMKSQAIDNAHNEKHEEFIMAQLEKAQGDVASFQLEIKLLHERAGDQSKASIEMVSALQISFDRFNSSLLGFQQSLMSGIGLRGREHEEVCRMLKTIQDAQIELRQTLNKENTRT